MHSHHRLLAGFALALPLLGFAQTTYVDDPTDLTWYKSRTGDSLTPNVGAGSILFTEGQASGSTFLTNFPSVSLAVGDTLGLTVGFTLGTLADTTNSFRFGLHNSGNTQVSANYNGTTNSAFSNDYGYMVNQSLNGGSASLYTRDLAGTTALLSSATGGAGYTQISTSNSGTPTTVESTTLNNDVDGDGQVRLVRVKTPLTPDDAARFIRLKVTPP